MTGRSPILGLILIILGCALLFVIIAPLIPYMLLALLGLYLVNYGLRLRSMPSAWHYGRSWWIQIDRYRNFR